MQKIASKFDEEKEKWDKQKNEQSGKHQCTKSKVVTWKEKEKVYKSNEDMEYSREKTPSHQDNQGN